MEQKNSTHIRKPLRYLHFDTKEEQEIINDLFRNELRLFKNFFQPIMKLKEKVKIKGRRYRKYDKPKTPYNRIMESDQIDKKINNLYEVYKQKKGSSEFKVIPNLNPSMVSYYMIHQL
ncbi:MAG: hypothetical protein PHR98_01840 [Candidatus Shapirobacteria bacterium]|nr:hypothetical protein [Candidatus Shapirobacteria bacterium]